MFCSIREKNTKIPGFLSLIVAMWGNPKEKSKQAKTRHSKSVMLDIDIFYTAGVGVDATGFSESRLAS